MADKSQNITINYKFNTAEIDRANAILNRANQASNQLQQSGQKAGQAINQSFGQARASIARMETDLARLKTQIQVSSDPKRVAELSQQYKVLKTQIDAANKAAFETPKAMKATQAATASATQQFGQLFQAAKLFVTAGIVREVFDIALNMATLKGNVEGVERAFARAFPNSVQVLEDLRAATQGTITDFELMQRTLQATNLGVGIESLPRLFEFAAARAQQTGESVDYLVDSIVRGIGRKSALILDNLGISALRLKEELNGVSLQAASVGEVTEAVGRIAEEQLTKMGGLAFTDAQRVKQLNANFEELRITLAKKIESGGLISFLNYSIEGLNNLIKGEKELATEEAKRNAARQVNAIVTSKEYKDLKDNQGAQIDILLREIIERQRLVRLREYEIKLAEEQKQAIRDDLTILDINAATEGINHQITAQKESKATLEQSIPILMKYIQQLRELAEVGDDAEPLGIIGRQKAEIERIQKLIEATNDASDLSSVRGGVVEVGKLIKELEIAQAVLADLQREFSDIDIKPFEIQVKDATKALLNFRGLANDPQGLSPLFSEEWLKEPDDSVLEGIVTRITGSLERLAAANPVTFPGVTVAQPDPSFWEELGNTWNENWQDIVSEAVDIQTNAINNALEADLDSAKNALNILRAYYDEQELLAGDNERKKKELRLREERETARIQKRIFEKEKATRRAQAAIDGAAGIIKAFATAPNIYVAIIQAALVAAETVAQIRNINRQQSGFAKGVIDLKGPGTTTSDSIPARLSKHESVMTAEETFRAGDVLRDIRAKKLDNKVLKDLRNGRQRIHASSPFDDKGIIKAIHENRPADVIEQSGVVFRVERQTETYHRKIRAKSIRL